MLQAKANQLLKSSLLKWDYTEFCGFPHPGNIRMLEKLH